MAITTAWDLINALREKRIGAKQIDRMVTFATNNQGSSAADLVLALEAAGEKFAKTAALARGLITRHPGDGLVAALRGSGSSDSSLAPLLAYMQRHPQATPGKLVQVLESAAGGRSVFTARKARRWLETSALLAKVGAETWTPEVDAGEDDG